MKAWEEKIYQKRVSKWLLAGASGPPPNFPCVFVPIEEKRDEPPTIQSENRGADREGR